MPNLQHKSISAGLAAAALFTAALLSAGAASAQTAQPRVQPANLRYLGAFKVPTLSGNGLDYGGTALAFNPANNSLFIIGHPYDNLTAELRIPAIGGTATVIQNLSDPTGGRLSRIGSGSARVGGQLVYNNTLYSTGFLYYDGDGGQSQSHFSRPLGGGAATGPLRVGSMGAGFYSGYMGHVPPDWQSRFGGPALTGNCCLSIISRTSFGPALFAFDPASSSQSAQPLVYYTSEHQTLGTYGASGKNPVFNGTTRVAGVVFPHGTSSVLFFGSTGTGNYCYGEASECGDPSNSSKGEHAYPYKAYVWAYDANELAAVRSGSKQPWSVRPYATWELTQLGNVIWEWGVGGAAYDPVTNRIYVSKKHDDDDRPRIHVYEVDNAAAALVPRSPDSFTVN